MTFDRARAIADAVLLEGYVLYPYRSTSCKNQYRWTFGVVAPRAWSEAGGCEPWWIQTECLVVPEQTSRVAGRLRFLQVVRRTSEPSSASDLAPMDPPAPSVWDEGALREVDFDLEIPDYGAEPLDTTVAFHLEGGDRAPDPRQDPSADPTIRLRTHPVEGRVILAAERVEAPHPLVRLRARIENVTPWPDLGASRHEALLASCVSTHLLLRVEHGSFLSVLDPPAWAEQAAQACRNVHAYPVLAGDDGDTDLLLSAPIALYDHPRIAPESPGDFHDATEIDELLALRTLLLTDEEKARARATDPRAAAIVDHVEAMPPEVLERLHGAIRQLRAAEMVPRPEAQPACVCVGLRPGMRVRLCPGARRTDAQDLLFVGQTATIEKVLEDVDGRLCFAVTLDADPAANLHRWYGRFHYYYADEVEPIVTGPGGDA